MLVELAGISKIFGARRALNRIRLTLDPGRVVAVVGLNGAGKTTLLYSMAGLLALDEGTVFFNDEPFGRDRVDQRRRFGLLPDFPLFMHGLTVLEHIAMALRLYEKEESAGIEERVLGLLRELDLLPLAGMRVLELSRGQAYKTALAALLAVNPELWLLDEPFASGMDPLGLRAFKQHARAAADAGGTILYTTQILAVAEKFSDEIILLHRGEILAHGTVSEVLAAGGQGADAGLEAVFAALREEDL